MKHTIEIDKKVLDKVLVEFRLLPKGRYKLTKTHSNRNGEVFVGDSVTGPLSIVNVIGKPGVKVFNDNYGGGDFELSYIRTSPVVEVLDATEAALTFRTEGGIYKLEKADK